MDARVHHLQAEAERLTFSPERLVTHAKADDLAILSDIHRDKLAARQRHVAVARHVSDYEFNNTYQYVIGREDTHLQWLEAAIADLGGTPASIEEPAVTPSSGKAADRFLPLVAEDAQAATALVGKWRPRLDEIGSERHRKMVNLMLGETLEQQRFFEHALAGRADLLGRRSSSGAPPAGEVLPARWLE